METLTGRLKGQDGTALIIAVIAMLVLGVIGFSFAILANLEVRIGMNQKHEVQALALAEAGLEHGRDVVRGAGSGNFGTWVNNASNGSVLITGQAFGGGTYSARIDNDCSTNTIVPGAPTTLADPSCGANQDGNETAALTAWATTANGLGRARVRVLVTYSNAWKRSCYNGNDQLCVDDQVPACSNQSCVSPSDPNHPNGPSKGQLPLPNDIRCGVDLLNLDPAKIPGNLVPTDMQASMIAQNTCVIFPYYEWAIKTPAPTRRDCVGGDCQDPDNPLLGSGEGTRGWNAADAVCIADASKCHGMVFFGPLTETDTGADITFGTGGGDQAECMGTRPGSSDCPGAASSVTVYVMGKVTVKNGVEINGTLVLHGNGKPGTSGPNKDLGLTGTNMINTTSATATFTGGCINTPAGVGCGYPLAILAYDPPGNDADDPTPASPTPGQSIYLDISNATTRVNGIVYTGGTADFNPITVNGSIMGWDVNVNNAATSITYNSTYGNATPPPGFPPPGGNSFPAVVRQSWIHCRDYSDDSGGPTACSN